VGSVGSGERSGFYYNLIEGWSLFSFNRVEDIPEESQELEE
jgi:hypothetical protein